MQNFAVNDMKSSLFSYTILLITTVEDGYLASHIKSSTTNSQALPILCIYASYETARRRTAYNWKITLVCMATTSVTKRG